MHSMMNISVAKTCSILSVVLYFGKVSELYFIHTFSAKYSQVHQYRKI